MVWIVLIIYLIVVIFAVWVSWKNWKISRFLIVFIAGKPQPEVFPTRSFFLKQMNSFTFKTSILFIPSSLIINEIFIKNFNSLLNTHIIFTLVLFFLAVPIVIYTHRKKYILIDNAKFKKEQQVLKFETEDRKEVKDKILFALATIFKPSLLDRQVYLKLSRSERFFRAVQIPAILLGVIIWASFFRGMEFGWMVVSSIMIWTYMRIINYGTINNQVSKQKIWPLVISNIFFDLLLIAIIFDTLKSYGVLDQFDQIIKSNNSESLNIINSVLVLLLVGVGYFLVFTLSSTFRHSLLKIYPSIKQFLRNKRLLYILINLIFFVLYFSFLFALAHYIIYIMNNFSGYTFQNLNFVDFIFYSFSILFSSPISSIIPSLQISIVVTAIESIFSYLLLVIFVAFVIDNFSKPRPMEDKRKKNFQHLKRILPKRTKILRKRPKISSN